MKPQEFIGKRLIIHFKKKLKEATIIEISPSEEYVKFRFINGKEAWADVQTFVIGNTLKPVAL